MDDETDYGEDEVDEIETQEREAAVVPRSAEADVSMHNISRYEVENTGKERRKGFKRNKKVKVSKHGIQYPSLPASVVKKLATTYARTSGNSKAKINKETLDAVMQASDWFFEQVSEDLGAYARHAGRKTIDESDVATLMKRQRQTNDSTTPFFLADRYLPRELVQNLRMAPPPKLKRGRQLEVVEEADEE
jgi:histone H3/H4